MNIQLRVTRLTDDLEAIIRFYQDGLGLEVIASFTDHAGFDGVMLGHVSTDKVILLKRSCIPAQATGRISP